MPPLINNKTKLLKQKVLSIPYYDRNPYLQLLSNSIRSYGYETVGSKFTWHIIKKVRSEQVSIIHFHWLHQWTSSCSTLKFALALPYWILQISYLRLKGIRLVWTIHNLQDHEKNSPIRDYLFSFLMSRLCHARICHSKETREKASKHFRIKSEKVNVIPHGNYCDWYPNTISRSDARNQLGIPENASVVLSLGEIRPYKNTVALIKAFNEIDAPNTILLVVGSCPKEELKRQIIEEAQKNQRVRLHLSYIPDEEIQNYMNAADIIALTYSNILTSGAALLAMSFGKAIIAPDIASFKELPGTKGAYIYQAENPSGISQALKQFIQDPLTTFEMSKNNKQEADQLNWDSIAPKLIKVYNKTNRIASPEADSRLHLDNL